MAHPAVIVLNSLVSRGGVGGRAAVFALERLGFPVWSVPTVLLPWHPGHGPGTRIVPPGLDRLVADLAASPRLSEVGGVLVGYVGEAEQAAAIAALVRAAKAANPSALVLLDPVIGDAGGPYMPAATIAAVRETLLPLADIATPNRYELEILAGRRLADNDALAAAARGLGPGEVVVTSAFAGAGEIANLLVTGDAVDIVAHRLLAAAPHGTGDLLAALHLGRRLAGAPPADALRRAVDATVAVIALAGDDDELPLAAGQAAFLQ